MLDVIENSEVHFLLRNGAGYTVIILVRRIMDDAIHVQVKIVESAVFSVCMLSKREILWYRVLVDHLAAERISLGHPSTRQLIFGDRRTIA